jgi:hypothetical protein
MCMGMQVRRSVLGEDGKPAGSANGIIIGWLPAHLSDFFSKETGQKAAVSLPMHAEFASPYFCAVRE